MRTSREIRQQFLDFFAARGHVIVPSSPVVPHDDPTLMFTNAGMNQFKDVFLGTGSRSYRRVADTQKCIRAGGKHNDLDDVGRDTYHHTFFEMLGNWSFGDYFKKEAIEWAWELLTKVWGIDKSRLHATYFGGLPKQGSGFGVQGSGLTDPPLTKGGPGGVGEEWELEPDYEARDLWMSMTDIDPSHVHPGNMKDNFWEMGDTGPCGPCSEIHIDLTPDRSGGALVNAGDARVMEIWNLVFIESESYMDEDGRRQLNVWDECSSLLEKKQATTGYQSRQDVLRRYRRFRALPAKHVDTGMGFERIVRILQGKHSNYGTDVFVPLIEAVERRANVKYGARSLVRANAGPFDTVPANRYDVGAYIAADGTEIVGGDKIDIAFRVIADHLRCLTFALTDGAIPSNEGRGYVLRRILRRAVFYGRQYLNMQEPFLCDLVAPLVELMGDSFPELRSAHRGHNAKYVAELIREEEASFFRTLARGMRIATAVFQGCRAIQNWKLAGSPSQYAYSLMHKSYAQLGNQQLINWKSREELAPPEEGYEEQSEIVSSFSLFDEIIDNMVAHGGAVPGRVAFVLHDTYGFPIDLTVLMAEKEVLKVDIGEYERLMEEARERSRPKSFTLETVAVNTTPGQIGSTFRPAPTADQFKYLGRSHVATVRGRFEQKGYSALEEGEEGPLILVETCFYAEQGGQVGDQGAIETDTGLFSVSTTIRTPEGAILHLGQTTRGRIEPDQTARLCVSLEHRGPTEQNHTATHILNWALREVLELGGTGKVDQKGSLVDPDKTRFDFSHNKPLTPEENEKIERLCNEQIEAGLPVYAASDEKDFVDQAKARQINTLRAVFGEKYPDRVRVVSIGASIDDLLRDPQNPKWMKHSVEFCGGTHVKNTREIEHFVLTHEEGVAKGVRRVVGVSGMKAQEAEQRGRELLQRAEMLLDPSRARKEAVLTDELSKLQADFAGAEIPLRIRFQIRHIMAQLQEKVKRMEKEQNAAAAGAVQQAVAELLQQADVVNEIHVVVGEVPEAPPEQLRGAIDYVRQRTTGSAVLLASRGKDRVTLLAGMSKIAVERGLKAGDLIKEISPLVGGKGGGRPDMAQGGGPDVDKIEEALAAAKMRLAKRIAGGKPIAVEDPSRGG